MRDYTHTQNDHSANGCSAEYLRDREAERVFREFRIGIAVMFILSFTGIWLYWMGTRPPHEPENPPERHTETLEFSIVGQRVMQAPGVAENGMPNFGLSTGQRGVKIIRHRIKRNERLTDMALYYYGSRRPWRLIVRQNGLTHASMRARFVVGRELEIPVAKSWRQPVPAPAHPRAPQVKKYVVKRNDNLWKIAKKFYGDATKHKLIQHENNLTNPNRLRVGEELLIPAIRNLSSPG